MDANPKMSKEYPLFLTYLANNSEALVKANGCPALSSSEDSISNSQVFILKTKTRAIDRSKGEPSVPRCEDDAKRQEYEQL